MEAITKDKRSGPRQIARGQLDWLIMCHVINDRDRIGYRTISSFVAYLLYFCCVVSINGWYQIPVNICFKYLYSAWKRRSSACGSVGYTYIYKPTRFPVHLPRCWQFWRIFVYLQILLYCFLFEFTISCTYMLNKIFPLAQTVQFTCSCFYHHRRATLVSWSLFEFLGLIVIHSR